MIPFFGFYILKILDEIKINKQVATTLITDDGNKPLLHCILFFHNLKRFNSNCGVINNYYSHINLIAQKLNCCESTIRKNISKLEKLGLIEKTKTNNKVNLRLASYSKVNSFFNVTSKSNYKIKLAKKQDIVTIIRSILLSKKIKLHNKAQTVSTILSARCNTIAPGSYIYLTKELNHETALNGLAKKVCKNMSAPIQISNKEIANGIGFRSKSSANRYLGKAKKLSLVFCSENKSIVEKNLSFKSYFRMVSENPTPGCAYIYQKGNIVMVQSNTVGINHHKLTKLCS